MAAFADLVGKTITTIDGAVSGSDEIVIFCSDGSKFGMSHSQDCCESVRVSDIVGDISDLLGSPITFAEEAESGENPEGVEEMEYVDSFTWTFYKLATIKGYVDIRWYGESNGYYSESVDFYEVKH